MPKVQNQIYPRLVTIVPRLMIKTIVEYDAFVLLQRHCLVTNTHSSAFDTH